MKKAFKQNERKEFVEKGIVLFDGECSFCNSAASSIISRDKSDYFRFATLDSNIGRQLRTTFGLETVDSVILIEKENAFVKSTAVLKILNQLSSRWKWIYVFRIIPRSIRDFAYDLFAASRYNFWGKQSEVCLLLTPKLREKFLDIA